MASRKAISVKIQTVKVIKALEAALAKLEKDYKNQKDNETKFQKALVAHNKQLAKIVLENVKKVKEVSVNDRSWRNEVYVNLTFDQSVLDLPETPQRDFEVIHEHLYRESKQELENAIRILKMTDEEVVSTSTYNAVARWL